MLQKPDIPDDTIIACLRDEFNLPITALSFLPLGADLGSAVYRAGSPQDDVYFVKLRRGVFDANTVLVPAFLAAQGIAEIIPPLAARSGEWWAVREPFRVIVYPYVEGQNGFAVKLSETQWAAFGAALKKIHASALSDFSLLRETFSNQWRDALIKYVRQASESVFRDALALELSRFILSKRSEILSLVAHAQELAAGMEAQAHEFVLCHADIHAGNLLIQAGGAMHIVDWDTVMLAPRERDLMFVGGAQGFAGYTPQQEWELFCRGYGPVRVNQEALAFYRHERIVEDLAVECEQVFSLSGSADDRAHALGYFRSNFEPERTLAMAYAADPGRRCWNSTENSAFPNFPCDYRQVPKGSAANCR